MWHWGNSCSSSSYEALGDIQKLAASRCEWDRWDSQDWGSGEDVEHFPAGLTPLTKMLYLTLSLLRSPAWWVRRPPFAGARSRCRPAQPAAGLWMVSLAQSALGAAALFFCQGTAPGLLVCWHKCRLQTQNPNKVITKWPWDHPIKYISVHFTSSSIGELWPFAMAQPGFLAVINRCLSGVSWV